jgi:hypothetical protein
VKKLTHFKPSLITKEFFPEYKDVSVINEGECFIWAYLAHLMFKDVEIWDVNCHAFVKYRGRFYDSEVLRGSPDWQDLPATEEADAPPRKHSVTSFKKSWHHNPKWFNTSWGEIESRARRVLRRAQASI